MLGGSYVDTIFIHVNGIIYGETNSDKTFKKLNSSRFLAFKVNSQEQENITPPWLITYIRIELY